MGCCGGDAAEEKERWVFASDREANPYPNNKVTNTKYTWWNFLFINLYEQFSLHMNRYFLLIGLLQLFPVLTPVNPLTTLVPLAVIFGVTTTKEVIDDRARAREDNIANSREYVVSANSRQSTIPSADIQVGDIVQVRDGVEIPADLVLLKSSEADGSCFVQTTNLDGETNLKKRKANDATAALSLKEVSRFKGVVECPGPNEDLYSFDANIYIRAGPGGSRPTKDPIPLSGEQLLQQGCRLRNTDWVYGVCVYSGNQTKFGCNKETPPLKMTQADLFVNTCSIALFIFQLVLVFALGIAGELLRRSSGKDAWYLRFSASDSWFEFIIIPARFLLLNSTMIPISLKLTMDLCKMYYSKFIEWDRVMYSQDSCRATVVKNASISEDLGQLSYILSDKTGTLTQNSMIFRKCMVGWPTDGRLARNANETAGRESELGPAANHVYDEAEFKDRPITESRMAAVIADGTDVDLLHFFKHIVLNNDVVVSLLADEQQDLVINLDDDDDAKDAKTSGQKKDGRVTVNTPLEEVVYKGPSPDEIALVEAAASCGVRLLHRDDKYVTISVNGEVEIYKILQTLAFTSDRKRMTVVVRRVFLDENGNEIVEDEEEEDENDDDGGDSDDDSEDGEAKEAAGDSDDDSEGAGSGSAEEEEDEQEENSGGSDSEEDSDDDGEDEEDEEEEEKKVLVLCKGADDMVISKLHHTQRSKADDVVNPYVDRFASTGLRTLYFASKRITDDDYTKWAKRLAKAQISMQKREEQVEQCFVMLESNLWSDGCSAIEDLLAEGVGDTIQTLRDAGLHVWMCTGDKQSTAEEIALSCNLRSQPYDDPVGDGSTDVVMVEIAGNDSMEVRERLWDVLHRYNIPKLRRKLNWKEKLKGMFVHVDDELKIPGAAERLLKDATTTSDDNKEPLLRPAKTQPPEELSVVVTGKTLQFVLVDQLTTLLFARLCMFAHTVVACRVRPAQKKQLVELCQNYGDLTLGVGDGGNDVAMIQKADIGVGIRGKEGQQAARAADYAVNEFSALQRLLLVHGRYSYARTALVAQYSFYKSMMFCCIQICFAFVSQMSGATLFNSLCITMYNALLFVPIVLFCMDKDVPMEVALARPSMYKQGPRRQLLNAKTFCWWMFRGMLQAVVVFTCTVVFRSPPFHMGGSGYPNDWETMGIFAFCAFLWVQSLTMMIELHAVTWYNIISIWGFHLLTFVILLGTNIVYSAFFDDLNPYYSVLVSFLDIGFWAGNIAIVLMCILPVVAMKAYAFNFHPDPIDHFNFLEKKNLLHRYVRLGGAEAGNQPANVAPTSPGSDYVPLSPRSTTQRAPDVEMVRL